MGIRQGKWLGKNGGGLTIESINGTLIVGTYRTNVGRVPSDRGFQTTGFTDGRLISFCTLWQSHDINAQSSTAWVGRYIGPGVNDGYGDSSRERIECNWNLHRLTVGSEEAPTDMWEANLSSYSILYWSEG